MIINSKCLTLAADRLKIGYKFLDDNCNLVKLETKEPIYFSNSSTPFNLEDVVSICKDKDFTYKVLGKTINIPKIKSYLDPNCNPEYWHYRKFFTQEEIFNDIKNQFKLPVIIKKNKGAQGENVFLCKNETEIKDAVKEIFNQESKSYDYIALAQEYIQIQKEYRVIVFKQKILLVYEKNTEGAKFTGNLSPLHWENAKAIIINDQEFIEKLNNFINPIYKDLDLIFGGLDIAVDENNQIWLIEINSKPGFTYFAECNGEKELVKMYEILLKDIIARN